MQIPCSSCLLLALPRRPVVGCRNGVDRCSGDGFDFPRCRILTSRRFFVNPFFFFSTSRLFFFIYLLIFFLFGRAARVQLPSPGPFGPLSLRRLIRARALSGRAWRQRLASHQQFK